MEVQAVAEAIGPPRVGPRINAVDEGNTGAIYRTLRREPAGDGPAYLHVLAAQPEDALHREIRATWRG